MNAIFSFFSDIFGSNSNNGMKVGLSQFKDEPAQKSEPKNQKVIKKETKLSDLMRGV